MSKTIIQIFKIMIYALSLIFEVQILNEQKLIKLLEFYKQYKALSGYIDKNIS